MEVEIKKIGWIEGQKVIERLIRPPPYRGQYRVYNVDYYYTKKREHYGSEIYRRKLQNICSVMTWAQEKLSCRLRKKQEKN